MTGPNVDGTLTRTAHGLRLTLYGAIGGARWVQHGVMLTGVLRSSCALGPTSTRWQVWLWDPW